MLGSENPDEMTPRRQVPTTKVRRIIAVFFLGLGLANAVASLASGAIHGIIPGIALIIWGIALWRPLGIRERVDALDIMSILVFIPLLPFYLNLGASALWGQEWWDLPWTTRLIPLGGGTVLAAVLALITLRLQYSEVRHMRQLFLMESLYRHTQDTQGRAAYEVRIDGLLERWLKVKLPLSRCAALITAGVAPENAASEDVRELTDENLRAIGWLAQAKPLGCDEQ